ncbi:MAG: sigma-70 family RNA polymerase sigma factor [Ruminiclostridium sp.]|jgi:RNA polymerase sigma-70 factor (ECF subfamily)|nr:sigma-70 family RNA polymerase sigma factor [Ruminiclostridium sp.]
MDEWVHELYQTCAPELFRIARYRLLEEQLAQDLVQEVFLLLLEKKDILKEHPNIKGWLMKTLNYRILHAVEQRGREFPLTELSLVPAPSKPDSLDEILPKQLSAKEKHLLKLFYEEGLSYQELSARLGMMPATCGSRLHRARVKCKKYLDEGKEAGGQ